MPQQPNPNKPNRFEQMVVDDLRRLGRTPKDIARGLRARGIKGRRNNASRCPVAHYLAKQYNTSVSVSHHVLEADPLVFTTPPFIVKFIDAFDKGEFEFLNE